MLKSKKLAALIMAGAMATALLTGCAKGGAASGDTQNNGTGGGGTSGGAYKIGYVNLADTDVFCTARKEALQKALDGKNLSIEFSDGNNDIQKQLDQANTFIAKGVNLLVLVPADAEGIVPAVTAANNAGIPVVCLGIKAASGDFVYVGSENYQAGHMQGEFMAEKLPENAQVMYLAGTAGLTHSADRRQGFQDALKEADRTDVQIVEDQDGDYQMAKAMQITEAWIQAHSKFDAVVAANDQMALGAVEALKGANRLEGVMISGVDGLQDAYKAIQEGSMSQTILQDAPGQAAAALKVIEQFQNGETPEKENIVPFQSVTAENVGTYMQ